jgi:hypothetical protein
MLSKGVIWKMPDTEGTKKERARAPRVRTGCITCKYVLLCSEFGTSTNLRPLRIRHLKCDEAKPECKRCLGFGFKCDGYVNKPKLTWKFVKPKLSPAASPLGSPLPTGIRFQNEKDFQYFRLFQYEISDELSAGFDPSLWNRIVLQMCALSPILQLSIATAALKNSKRPQVSDELKRSHEQYALQQYGSALQGVRRLLENSQHHSLRIALVVSLIIYCFEGIAGDPVRAIANIKTTMDLMSKQLMTKYRPDAQRIYPDSQLEEQLLVKFRQLGKPTVTVHNRSKTAPLSPAPNVDFMSTLYTTDLHIPETFHSVDEARFTLEQIRYLSTLNYRAEKISNVFPLRISNQFKSQLAQWKSSFAPLFDHSQTEARSQAFISATTLAIQASTFELIYCGPRQHSVSVFSSQNTVLGIIAFASGYRTSASSLQDDDLEGRQVLSSIPLILKLCHSLVDHHKFVKSFVCDVGIIPMIWAILMTSPDRDQRVDALQVLRKMQPREEGVYNSTHVAEAGEQAIRMLDSRENSVETELNKVESFDIPHHKLSVVNYFN